MRRFFIIVLFAILAGSQFSFAQIKIVPKEKLDSVATPPLAPNAADMTFDKLLMTSKFQSGDNQDRTFEYGFVNRGESPLVISRLVSTCSCTKAEYDKRLVKPGERAVIRLVYSPEGRLGTNVRRVFVYTNDNAQPTAILRLEVTHL